MPDDSRPEVVLVDDHAVFLEGLQTLLEHRARVRVVGHAGNAAEAEDVVSRLQPDLILLDADLGDNRPVEANIRRLLRAAPSTRIVILTMHTSPALRDQTLRCGASAFLSKSATGSEVEKALISAYRNAPPAVPPSHEIGHIALLTPRECEVLRLVALAMSNREISEQLSIVEGTVKRHTSSAYAKLNAASRLDAVQKATRLGLI